MTNTQQTIEARIDAILVELAQIDDELYGGHQTALDDTQAIQDRLRRSVALGMRRTELRDELTWHFSLRGLPDVEVVTAYLSRV